jgi:hypothetical protein
MTWTSDPDDADGGTLGQLLRCRSTFQQLHEVERE